MGRGRHSRRSLSPDEKKQIKEKHKELCAKGKHTWRPFFTTEHLGGIPKWDGHKIYCDYCLTETTFAKLEKSDKKLVKEIAKVLDGVHEQVRQLYHPRTFSNAGI